MARSAPPPRAWQRMLSGRRLDLIDPSPLDIEIEDIAHGLARVPRWNGQTLGDHIFSVAQHSVLVCQIAEHLNPKISPKLRLALLLHDAAEYVIGDMISPFKSLIGEPYKDVEKRLMGAVHIRFGLPATLSVTDTAFIKKADSVCAYFEATQLAGFSDAEAKVYFKKTLSSIPNLDLTPWPAPEAEKCFLERFYLTHRLLVSESPPTS